MTLVLRWTGVACSASRCGSCSGPSGAGDPVRCQPATSWWNGRCCEAGSASPPSPAGSAATRPVPSPPCPDPDRADPGRLHRLRHGRPVKGNDDVAGAADPAGLTRRTHAGGYAASARPRSGPATPSNDSQSWPPTPPSTRRDRGLARPRASRGRRLGAPRRPHCRAVVRGRDRCPVDGVPGSGRFPSTERDGYRTVRPAGRYRHLPGHGRGRCGPAPGAAGRRGGDLERHALLVAGVGAAPPGGVPAPRP